MSPGIGKWLNLALLLCVAVCQTLVGYSHVFVCAPAQLHAFIPTAMCTLCRLVCAWTRVLELHIRFTKITFSARHLAFLSGRRQSSVTARMSRESERATRRTIIPNLAFKAAQQAAAFTELLTRILCSV